MHEARFSVVETVRESATLNIAASPGQNIKGINNQYWWYQQNTTVSVMCHVVV